jgi:hypothetical protein
MRILRAFRRPGPARVGDGEVAEWLKAHAWKACLGETLTRVRIPLSPPAGGDKALILLFISAYREARPQYLPQLVPLPVPLEVGADV